MRQVMLVGQATFCFNVFQTKVYSKLHISAHVWEQPLFGANRLLFTSNKPDKNATITNQSC